MGIKTVHHPPLLPVTFSYSLSSEAVVMRIIEEMKEAVTMVIDTLTQEDFHRGLSEVTGTVKVHCSRRRLLRMGLEFHVCTINKSAHTKKLENYLMILVCKNKINSKIQISSWTYLFEFTHTHTHTHTHIYIYIYIYICVCVCVCVCVCTRTKENNSCKKVNVGNV